MTKQSHSLTGARIFVVGNINRDIKTAPLTVQDELFEDGETPVSSIAETVGGGGANSACAAARLGAAVAFAGKIGTDSTGDRLAVLLETCGVRGFLTRSQDVPTGTSVNLNFQNGRRHFLSCLPNNTSLQFNDLDLSELSEYGHLLRADIWFSESMLYGGNERLFTRAREAGLTTSLDLNWDPQWNRGDDKTIARRRQAVRDILPLVDVAHGNVTELNRFCDTDDIEQSLHRLAQWGAGSTVVHMGSDGAGLYRNGNLTVEAACPIDRQVHTTGCGDVLSVCMIGLHHRTDLSTQEKLRTANAIVASFIEGHLSLLPELP